MPSVWLPPVPVCRVPLAAGPPVPPVEKAALADQPPVAHFLVMKSALNYSELQGHHTYLCLCPIFRPGIKYGVPLIRPLIRVSMVSP